jgi:Sulfotransferase family
MNLNSLPSRERVLSLGLKDPTRQEPPPWLRASRHAGHSLVRRVTRQISDGGIRRPPQPPACPAGWQVGPPHFVGIGGQRCGTTRWFDLIASHPEVLPPLVAKELHFFDRFYTGGFDEADARAYHRYFPRPAGRMTGEWTPGYLSAPWIPGLLAHTAPNARLLVLLRDPVERYLSGLEHDARMAAQQGAPLSALAPIEAFARGLYHAQLTRVLRHFDRSRVLVLQYERCVSEPLAQLERTFDFLGLEQGAFLPDVSANPHLQQNKPRLSESVLGDYVEAYSGDVLRLAREFDEIDLALWPNFAHLAGPLASAPRRAAVSS